MWTKKQAAHGREELGGDGARPPRWWPVLASVGALAVVAATDLATGPSLSVWPLYLLPVGIAARYQGRIAGVLIACSIAAILLGIELPLSLSLAASLWNAAMHLVVLLSFAWLVDRLGGMAKMPAGHSQRSRGWLPQVVFTALAVAVSVMFIALGSSSSPYAPEQALLVSDEEGERSFVVNVASKSPAVQLAGGPIGELLTLYKDCVQQSRPLLLGSRDPRGGSCLTPIKTGTIVDTLPQFNADMDGGVGTNLILVLANSRNDCHRPSDELASFQQRLRRHLQNQLSVNERALAAAIKLANRTRVLVTMIEQGELLPTALESRQLPDADDRIGHCLFQFDRAIAQRDAAGAKVWGAELASAAFTLGDLHLWLAFLFENYLTALDFQQQCATLYAAADSQPAGYGTNTTSYMPGGLLILHGDGNFLEVERRAEQMFSLPDEERVAIADTSLRSRGSLWISPAQRSAYLQLERALSAANRRVLRRAARTPYEATYLNAMLDRAERSETLDQLLLAARRFDATHTQATVPELMEVLMYRGHSFGGLEWGDRYHAALVDEAAHLDRSDLIAFEQACVRTNNFYKQSVYSRTFTLRESLERKQLDCIRATDMIAALYRNAGHAGIGHVRWSCENFGHSVAAILGQENGRPTVSLADAMESAWQLERWPDAYFQGHRWPTGLEQYPNPYCAELYVRGLDNYVWAEGYIIRGPNAGMLYSAAIPYLPGRTASGVRKAFAGPYPE
ncbi:MAG: hypothetical protein AB7U73_09670 [Pirellulales bacterium]